MIGTAHLNGTTFAYEIAGRGAAADDRAPVVLIHAGIADSRMWGVGDDAWGVGDDAWGVGDDAWGVGDDAWGVGDDAHASPFAALAREFTVMIYDLRGFGRTPPLATPAAEEPAAGAQAATFAHHDDLAALLRHLGLARVALVGCSVGSRVALDFALQYPQRVARLVLVSPTISGWRYDGPPPAQAAELDAADAAGDLARVNELEMQIWVDGPHRRPDEVDARVRELARDMNAIALANEAAMPEERPLAPPAIDRLAEVRAPALIIAGELDQARTRAAAGHLAVKLPRSRLEIVPGAAHLPNMERSGDFNRLLLDFFNA